MFNLFSLVTNSSYSLNPYSIMPMVVAWISLFQGVFIYYLDKKNHFNRCVYYFCLAVFLWQMVMAELFSCADIVGAQFLSKMLFISIAIAGATTFHLSAAFTGLVQKKKHMIALLYVCALLVALGVLKGGFFSSVHINFFGMYPVAGPNLYFLVFFVAACFLFSFINFTQYHFLAKDIQERRYTRFLMMLYFVLQFSFVDVSISYSLSIFPVSSVILLIILLGLSFEEFRVLKGQVIESRKQGKSELAEKSIEMSKIVGDLKDAHLKLLEGGKMSALASLSAGILHQISQPITAIKGVSSFLKSELETDHKHYKAICLIDEQSTVLREKLSDILELIKQRKIRKERLNVNDVVTRVMSLVMDELRLKSIKWEAQLDGDMVEIFADSVHLQQIFINLITNAVQALDTVLDKDSRYLVISTKYNKEKEVVDVSFQDTGPCVTKEDEKHVFEPFFPVISARAGIGLALCKDLVDEHSGQLTLENPDGGGANFVVTFPIARDDQVTSDVIE